MKLFAMDFDKAEIKDEFKRNGFVHVKSFFDQRQCEEAIQTIINYETSIRESNSPEVVTETIQGKVLTKYYQGAYRLGPVIRKFFSLKLLVLGGILLESEDVYYSDLEAHIRNPGGGEIPKHQDNFYFNLKSGKGLTCYVALNEHDANSGGLNYVRRSHQRVIEHRGSVCAGFSSEIREDSVEFKEKKAMGIYSPTYGVGDVTLHHANNIHYSRSVDRGCERRYALSVRIFDATEDIDKEGKERYLRLLEMNRSSK